MSLIEHQQTNYFLKFSDDYNKDLIRVFYFGLQMRCGFTFKLKIGNTNYAFTDVLSKSLFGIIVVDSEPLMTHTNSCEDFCWKVYMNEFLKAPQSDDCFEPLTTCHLKRVHHILHWLVSHVLHLKKGRNSRVDQVNVHIVYILFYRIHIN